MADFWRLIVEFLVVFSDAIKGCGFEVAPDVKKTKSVVFVFLYAFLIGRVLIFNQGGPSTTHNSSKHSKHNNKLFGGEATGLADTSIVTVVGF